MSTVAVPHNAVPRSSLTVPSWHVDTLLPTEPRGAPATYGLSCKLLSESLPEVSAPRVVLAKAPDFYSLELATELVN